MEKKNKNENDESLNTANVSTFRQSHYPYFSGIYTDTDTVTRALYTRKPRNRRTLLPCLRPRPYLFCLEIVAIRVHRERNGTPLRMDNPPE